MIVQLTLSVPCKAIADKHTFFGSSSIDVLVVCRFVFVLSVNVWSLESYEA